MCDGVSRKGYVDQVDSSRCLAVLLEKVINSLICVLLYLVYRMAVTDPGRHQACLKYLDAMQRLAVLAINFLSDP